MTKHLSTVLLSAALFAPLPLMAQDYSGSVTLGYGKTDLDILGTELGLDSMTFDGDIKVTLQEGLTLGLRANYANVKLDIPGVPGIDINPNLLGANVAYAFQGGGWIGAYTENFDLGTNVLPINLGVTDFGIEGGYAANGLGVSGFVGKSADITSYGLKASYDLNGQGQIAANYTRSNIDAEALFSPLFELDVDQYGIAAAYSFNENWGVFAGYGRTSIKEFDVDLTSYGLGASYTFTGGSTPVAVSLEFARSDIGILGDSVDFDTVRLGVTLPFGTKTNAVPKNSVADAILNPTHSALSQALYMAF